MFEKEEMQERALEPYTISFDLSESCVREPQEEAVLKLEQVHLCEGGTISFSLKRGMPDDFRQ
ncbi:MAG: hypothetical protein QM683_02620 [Lacrimispora sp.]